VNLPRWWKCKIASKDEIQLEFKKGTLLFAKNGEDHITLFDGKKWVSIPKMAVTKIKLLSRLGEKETAFVERYYQFKLRQASHSSTAGAPGMLWTQDAQTLDVAIPFDTLFGKEVRRGL
jgi:hypothetical protein